LDPRLVAESSLDAAHMDTLDALPIVKDGRLIAEGCFHDGAPGRKARIQSVTKSYTSALVGIVLDRGCLAGVDQKMRDFFPELADQVTDPKKMRITIRQLLQMRAGERRPDGPTRRRGRLGRRVDYPFSLSEPTAVASRIKPIPREPACRRSPLLV